MTGMSDYSTDTISRRESAREGLTGRFGKQEHSLPDVGLMTEADIEARIARSEELQKEYGDATAILEGVTESAKYYAMRGGLGNHVDDIIGDTIVDVIGQQRRGAEHVTARAFLVNGARAVTSRYYDPNAHHKDLKARREFKEKVEKLQQESGETLSRNAVDKLA